MWHIQCVGENPFKRSWWKLGLNEKFIKIFKSPVHVKLNYKDSRGQDKLIQCLHISGNKEYHFGNDHRCNDHKPAVNDTNVFYVVIYSPPNPVQRVLKTNCLQTRTYSTVHSTEQQTCFNWTGESTRVPQYGKLLSHVWKCGETGQHGCGVERFTQITSLMV